MERGKNVIIAGSRTFNDYGLLKEALELYFEQNRIRRRTVRIICGGAKGADHLGIRYANEKHLCLDVFEPDWARYGRGAGLKRNEAMVNNAIEAERFEFGEKSHYTEGVLFAFWNGRSQGTKHIIDYAEKNGLEVHVFHYEE